MESVNLDRFFATMNAELNAYDRYKKLAAPQLAPDFNMVSCFYPDENRLSAIIAMLLDPNGEHGQGDTFIHLFLDTLETENHNVDTLNLVRQGLRTGRSRKVLEAPTYTIENSQRRIDILLELGDTGLAIENKPWAGDQEKQVEDYIGHLDNRYSGRYLLIYLSGNGETPGEESLTAEKREKLKNSGHFLVFSYPALRNWISLCAEKSRSTRVRCFLEDFASYVTLEFDGGLTIMEKQVVIEHATKSQENLSAAFAIASSWPDIAKRLIEKLTSLVVEEVGLDQKKWKWNSDFGFDEKYSKITFMSSDWKHYQFAFEFQNSKANGLIFGILKIDDKITDFPEHLKLLEKYNESKLGKGTRSDWWPWYQKAPEPFRDWSNSEEPWAGITEGGMTVKMIAEKLRDLKEICEADINNLEQELKKSSS